MLDLFGIRFNSALSILFFSIIGKTYPSSVSTFFTDVTVLELPLPVLIKDSRLLSRNCILIDNDVTILTPTDAKIVAFFLTFDFRHKNMVSRCLLVRIVDLKLYIGSAKVCLIYLSFVGLGNFFYCKYEY